MGRRFLALSLVTAILSGCATPRVVLYPDDHYKSLPQAAVQKDISDCDAQADEYVKSHKLQMVGKKIGVGAFFGALLGVVFGAFSGNYVRAVAEGAAMGGVLGLAHGAVAAGSPDEVHRRFVETCLGDKGYKPIGWK